jgi:hypothetical protein
MGNGNVELTDSVMQEIERKIDTADQDDPLRLLLILNRANYKEIQRTRSNPMFRFGEMFRDLGRGFTLFVLILAYLLIVIIPATLYRILLSLLGIDPSILVP